MDIRSAVISIGQALGFDKVRISSVSTGKDTEFVHEWLRKGFAGEMAYLKKRAEEIRQGELEKVFSRLPSLSSQEREILQGFSSSIVNKILHKPTISLKKKTQSQDGHIYLKAIRHLFHLDD